MNSGAHTCPIAKVKSGAGIFFIPAFKNMIEGQKISFEEKGTKEGNIMRLKNIPIKTKIYLSLKLS